MKMRQLYFHYARTRCSSPSNGIGAFWSELRRAMFDPYRPERHYMRGPGPKWRARHAQTVDAP
jgi:hypothetical protein